MKEKGETMKALLITDLLNDFMDPRGALYVGPQGQETVNYCRELIQQKRDQGYMIIYGCDRHRKDDAEFSLYPPHSVEGTWGAEIIEAVAPQSEDLIIPKIRFDAFTGTSLDLRLRERGVQTLETVGVCTNICVLYSTAWAVMHGYRVRVFPKGVTSFDLDAHDFALREMKNTLQVEIG